MHILCFMLLPLLLQIALLCMAASIFDDCDLIWFNPFIDLLFLAGMTSPAPPNTRQVRLQLLISVFYLRSFERVAFKSGYSINKLPHCKAWINMQQQKIPTSQNYSGWISIAASLFVFVSLVPWYGSTFDFCHFSFLDYYRTGNTFGHWVQQILFYFAVSHFWGKSFDWRRATPAIIPKKFFPRARK